MRALEQVKNIRKYLSLLTALVLVVTGLLLTPDVPSVSWGSPEESTSRLHVEPSDVIVLRAFEAESLCSSPYVYTSLPPKCRTADGSFTPLEGFPSILHAVPPAK